jgi:acetyltransferase-like isoleucine patch superfamily enzyme
MDSNFHYIKNVTSGNVEKCTKSIQIGNNNWIGSRSTIMKGTKTPDYLIVGSNSLLNKNYTKSINNYSVIGGVPAKLISTGYERIFDYDKEKEYNLKFGRVY